MPEYLRSFVVVAFIATAVFFMLRPALAPLMPPGAYPRRRNAFLALTACAFLAPGFWFYALPASLVILWAARREDNIPALFLTLLFCVPPAAERIPGMGLVNFLLNIDHPRMLALLLLLPAAIVLYRRPSHDRMLWPDRICLAYLLLQSMLVLSRGGSFTNGLRGVVYLLIDVFLPYYVASRAFTTLAQLKDALAAFCVSAAVLAGIGIFESLKHWLLYRALLDRWAADFGMGNYLMREGLVRATASTGQPIVLGYVLMVALTCFLALRAELRARGRGLPCLLLLLGGLFATYSRGPWLGAAIAALAFWATARASRMRWSLTLGAVVLVALAMDTQLPSLPQVRDVDPSTVDYRADLLTKSLQVFWDQPWFGSNRYVQDLAERGMVQGQGIVDIVNTYVGIALSAGAVGLALFTGLFAAVLFGVWKSQGGYPAGIQGPNDDARGGATLAARALFASVLGTLVTIATVSSVSVIPWVYWTWIGMGVAYMRIAVQRKRALSPSARTNDVPSAS